MAYAPSLNEKGIPYYWLYQREKESSDRLIRLQKLALEMWMEATAAPKNSNERKRLATAARRMTEKILS